ncbi:MAG: hypothetical protein GF384_09075 [Elusimicrobia bacterium]|nr:hypothetical protein [Elusimicrobiota bacterium]MBD3412737.1 hypothetical protein [Elusimicrobiota bacterium]
MSWPEFRERRKYIRVLASTEVLVFVPEIPGFLSIAISRSSNICRRGIMVDNPRLLKPKKSYLIKFHLANLAITFGMTAQVRWNKETQDGYTTGMYFKDIEAEPEELIDHYVLKTYNFKTSFLL